MPLSARAEPLTTASAAAATISAFMLSNPLLRYAPPTRNGPQHSRAECLIRRKQCADEAQFGTSGNAERVQRSAADVRRGILAHAAAVNPEEHTRFIRI